MADSETDRNLFPNVQWFNSFGWSENPFKIQPDPEHVVGFIDIRAKLLSYIHSGDPFLVIGPTGSGKTTLLKWIERQKIETQYHNFLLKLKESEFRKIFTDSFFKKLIRRITNSEARVALLDEVQEIKESTAGWLKGQFDEGELSSLVMASVSGNLSNLRESLLDRIGRRSVFIRNLTEKEAFQIVRQRIFSHGKHNPFDDSALKLIFEYSKYSPRKILENCEAVCIYASFQNIFHIDENVVKKALEMGQKQEKKHKKLRLSPTQVKIIRILENEDLTTNEIAKKLNVSRASIAKQLSRLALKTDKKLLENKGITLPLVEVRGKGRPVIYRLTEEGKIFSN